MTENVSLQYTPPQNNLRNTFESTIRIMSRESKINKKYVAFQLKKHRLYLTFGI